MRPECFERQTIPSDYIQMEIRRYNQGSIDIHIVHLLEFALSQSYNKGKTKKVNKNMIKVIK